MNSHTHHNALNVVLHILLLPGSVTPLSSLSIFYVTRLNTRRFSD